MKIVEINAYDFGSTGKIMLQIAEVARKYGLHVYTFSSSRMARKAGITNHEYIDKYIDYRVHMIFGMLSGYEMSFSYFATRRLIKKMKEISPDIIHLHNTHGWFLNHRLLFNYIKRHNVRVIWTLHDCWTFTGRCPHFLLTGCDRWKSGCHNCLYDKNQYPASFIFDRSKHQWKLKKKMFTAVDNMTIITPSKWLAELVKVSYMGKYPVKVINNGIDLSVFKPSESSFRKSLNLEGKYIILGVASSWGRRKGLDVFIKLSQMLDENYKIVLVGLNKGELSAIPKNIICIERVNNQTELAEIYTAADVFANPTREDNFPTVNMEALACGTPVVTFNTGGSPEVIDESCGSVVDCDDVHAFAKEIKRICEEKPFSQEACLKRAKNFDMNDKFIEYVKLYQEIG
jgi:putative colanic acid biosynthesis glycosyltransferase